MPTTLDPITGDPIIGAHFQINVSGLKIFGFFSECSGMSSETEVLEHKIMEVNGESVIYKIPGRQKWGDITLKRGITANIDMWLWRKQVEDGDIVNARQHGLITLFSQEFIPVAVWEFYNGWPSKISSPAIKADSNEVMIEELTIAHEGIRRMTGFF